MKEPRGTPRRLRATVIATLLLGLAVGGAWVLPGLPRVKKFPEPGGPLADFAYPSLAGDTVSLWGQRGRVVLVNIWATWCPPCREEMPSIQRLYEAFGDSGFTVLAVSIDADTTPVRPFVEELGLTFPILLDPRGSIQTLYGTVGVPESFVVDRSGRLVLRRLGADDWFSEAHRARVATLLREPGP